VALPWLPVQVASREYDDGMASLQRMMVMMIKMMMMKRRMI